MEWLLLIIVVLIFSFLTDRNDYTTQKDLKHVPYDMYKPYKEYLKSDRWKKLRKIVLNRDNNKCIVCGTRYNLQVHHLHYKGIYENMDFKTDQLVTLCKKCHDIEHSK